MCVVDDKKKKRKYVLGWDIALTIEEAKKRLEEESKE